MSFKTVDYLCSECGHVEEYLHDLRGLSEEERETLIQAGIKCSECGHENMERAWLNAPKGKIGKDSDPKNLDRMKDSFRERYVKKEQNDVRHKFGRLYDDSLRSAEVSRIKQDLAKKNK